MPIPLFTIVTATYNAEKFLEQSILSVLGQSYTDFQLLLIDARSADKTVDIIRRFSSDKRIEWISEKDNGIYDAWNKAVGMARGEWIMFLGADDILLPGALQSYATFLSGLTTPVDYISSKMEVVQPESLKPLRIVGSPWVWKEFRLVNHMAHQGSLHSRSLFSEVGLFDPGYKISGDYELLLRKRDGLQTAFMDKLTVKARFGGVSASGKALKEQMAAISSTGQVNHLLARANYYRMLAKLTLRSVFLKMGINVYLRSSRSK